MSSSWCHHPSQSLVGCFCQAWQVLCHMPPEWLPVDNISDTHARFKTALCHHQVKIITANYKTKFLIAILQLINISLLLMPFLRGPVFHHQLYYRKSFLYAIDVPLLHGLFSYGVQQENSINIRYRNSKISQYITVAI